MPIRLEYGHYQVLETDSHRLLQREKQIAFGVVTPGYEVFNRTVGKAIQDLMATNSELSFDGVQVNVYKNMLFFEEKVLFGGRPFSTAPNSNFKAPKRNWDALISQWRRDLHAWDAPLDPENLTPTEAKIFACLAPTIDEQIELTLNINSTKQFIKEHTAISRSTQTTSSNSFPTTFFSQDEAGPSKAEKVFSPTFPGPQ